MNIPSQVLQFQKEVSRLQRRVEHLELELLGHKVDKPTFPFLQLPREIRNQIYLCALMRASYVNLSSQYMGIHRPPTPAIYLVNRQLSAEANEILYSRNIIHFDDRHDIHDCRETIGTTSKSHIRSISIWFDYPTIEQCQRDGV